MSILHKVTGGQGEPLCHPAVRLISNPLGCRESSSDALRFAGSVCVCVSWCLSELIKVCLSTIWRDKAQGFLVYRCPGMNTFCHIPFILVLLITFSASRPLHHSLVPHSASCRHFFVLCVLCSCHHYFLFLLSVSF